MDSIKVQTPLTLTEEAKGWEGGGEPSAEDKTFSGVTSTFSLLTCQSTQCAMQTGRFCIWVQTFGIPTAGQPIHDNSIQF